jgi:Uma2 family endonuclease
MAAPSVATASPEQAEPAWEIARIFPSQGTWSEEEYLALKTNHLVEFSQGYVEVLSMPTQHHQLIVAYLYTLLLAFAQRFGGTALFAPFRVRLWEGKFREPDLMFMLPTNTDRRHDNYWDGADVVIEAVSPDDPQRDFVTKRQEYAQAGIPEYWIVDPQAELISVLRLEQDQYAEHGQFGRGAAATSPLLAGLQIVVDAVFSVAHL